MASRDVCKLLILAMVKLASGIETMPPLGTVRFAQVVVPVREGDATLAFRARDEFTSVVLAFRAKAAFTSVAFAFRLRAAVVTTSPARASRAD